MHTTAAYQAAVAQLLIGEANFVGRQLQLPGWNPIQATNEVSLDVELPTGGVGGILTTSDYRFWYANAQLSRVERIKRLDGPKRNWPTDEEFLQLKPLVGTNEARVLARNWLQTLGMETNRLEMDHSFRALQPRIRTTPITAPQAEFVPSPFMVLEWKQPVGEPWWRAEYAVQVRADTKELWNIELPPTNSFMAVRKLVVTNKAELLGPEPPPLKFVTDMFGGPAAYNTVIAPTKVEAELVDQKDGGRLRWVSRKGPVQVTGKRAERLSRLLGDFESYQWTTRRMCIPDYGVRLRFYQGRKLVEVLLCFKCFDILIDGRPGEPFLFSHAELLKLMRELFPGDAGLEKLEPAKENWAAFYKGMEQQLRYYEAKER